MDPKPSMNFFQDHQAGIGIHTDAPIDSTRIFFISRKLKDTIMIQPCF